MKDWVSICEDNNIALILIDGGVVFEDIVPYFLVKN